MYISILYIYILYIYKYVNMYPYIDLDNIYIVYYIID